MTDNPKHGATTPLPELLTNAPLCGAKTRATTSCRSPCVKGKSRCRMHGARAGAPKGEDNGKWKHGSDTREAVELRRQTSSLPKAISGEAYSACTRHHPVPRSDRRNGPRPPTTATRWHGKMSDSQ